MFHGDAMLASGSQLGQLRPGDTNNASIYTATLRTEITRVVICNTTGTAADARLFHDDDGSTFDQTTALLFDKAIPANDVVEVLAGSEGSGIHVAVGGQIGVRTATLDALTFTLYGVTEDLSRRVA